MKHYVNRPTTIQAEQITVENIERLATLCEGDVKGMRLPPERRVINLWDKRDDHEVRADVGDYIIQREDGSFGVVRKAVFACEWVEMP